jgi:MrfA Zn-binding domain
MLEIDSRELGVSLKALTTGEQGILPYDTVPGGAGHCLEVMQLGKPWLDGAKALLRGSEVHDQSCRRACLECLLDFAGQFYADKLDRAGRLSFLPFWRASQEQSAATAFLARAALLLAMTNIRAM